jgi:hypothetical protein
MNELKTKSMERIERAMAGMDTGSLRYQVLMSAKRFKTSWVDLGRVLYTVWKDKRYKEWGYLAFDAYAARELGIRKQTALKLLKSYFFLEREQAVYLRSGYLETAEAASVPGYESINLLRLAEARKGLPQEALAVLRKSVLEEGREPQEVRRDLTALLRQREELEPEEAGRRKKVAAVKRLLGTLKSLTREAELLKLLSAPLLSETARLIGKLEAELGRSAGCRT